MAYDLSQGATGCGSGSCRLLGLKQQISSDGARPGSTGSWSPAVAFLGGATGLGREVAEALEEAVEA
jgi:hypothetical protein